MTRNFSTAVFDAAIFMVPGVRAFSQFQYFLATVWI